MAQISGIIENENKQLLSIKVELYTIFNKYHIQIDLNDINAGSIKNIYQLFKYDILFEPIIKESIDKDLEKKHMDKDIQIADEYKIIGLYFEFIKQDNDKADKYYELSLELIRHKVVAKNPIAMLYMGHHHIRIGNNVLGFRYYRLAYKYGLSDGLYFIGLQCYENNNNKAALEYFMRAINAGNTDAMIFIAYICLKAGDYDRTIKYNKMAAKNGNKFASYNLAHCYRNLGKSCEKVMKYFIIALNDNIFEAAHAMIDYYYGIAEYLKALLLAIKYFNIYNISRRKIIILFEINWKMLLDDYKYGDIRGTRMLSKQEKSIILELIKNFEFNESDMVCKSLKVIINSFKNNNISDAFNNKIAENIYGSNYKNIVYANNKKFNDNIIFIE